jgi:acetate---CoA ligase (ADP-forming)
MNNKAPLHRALFEPEVVAIVGASNEAEKTTGRPLDFLIRHGFAGDIFPINPRRDHVLGRRSYPDLGAVPRPVDLAYILLPTEPAMLAVEDCVRHGVKVIAILADGFAETGAAGRALQDQLRSLVVGSGSRIIGPNSLGIVRTRNGLSMTANAAFARERLPRGRYAVLSQSGSLIGTFVSRGRVRGIGFSNLVSVGNEADLSIGEIGECLIDDPETDSFLLFIETIRHADKLAAFAGAAHAAGKPILAYKLGRSDVGAELAVSHTGALVGSDAAADVFLRELGIGRVTIFEALFEAPPLLCGRRPRKEAPSVTMMTTTGGGAAMVADQLGLYGIGVKGVDDDSRESLAQQGINIKSGRIIDLTLAGTRYQVVRAIMDKLLTVPHTEALVAVIGSSAESLPQQTVAPIVDAVKAAPADHPPVAVFLVPQADAALTMLTEASIACFRTAESCADAIRAWAQTRPMRVPPRVVADASVSATIAGKQAGWTEHDALNLFTQLGVPCVAQHNLTVDHVLGGEPLPPDIRFPLVAKLSSPDIPHKTEAGAVTLGISSADALRGATQKMLAAAKVYAPTARIDGVLLQPQLAAAGEVLLGLRWDPCIGPILTLGMGGTTTEIYRDIALRLAPITASEAAEMLTSVKGLALLRGYRGRPLGDLAALAAAAAAFSRLAAYPEIREAEINPLLVMPIGHGVVAVDGLVVRQGSKLPPM